ncbi:MAG: hypothetical protein PWR20_1409 [Bacteroidales bacterium]|jgi:hypothetical protein|nr:hypothetical protein [Bacteroidales bacterium]MDN5329651.1 hypothetical protein [Bacteroidales bacterium]
MWKAAMRELIEFGIHNKKAGYNLTGQDKI